MQKLKLSIVTFFIFFGMIQAQEFVEPFVDFFSLKDCYVVTKKGEEIRGKLQGATSARGFITRLTIVDESGFKQKFKAHEIERFAIRPDVMTKLNTIGEKTTSIRHAIRTDYDNLLDREWIYFDSQKIPRGKKIGLLQLLNPDSDDFFKVYYHPNGSKSMTLRIKGIPIIGGEERTYLVVKDSGDTEIVRKASFERTYRKIFADVPVMLEVRNPNFKNFADHIANYNDLRYQKMLILK